MCFVGYEMKVDKTWNNYIDNPPNKNKPIILCRDYGLPKEYEKMPVNPYLNIHGLYWKYKEDVK